MATEFVLPELGEGIDEADVTNVYVHEGDTLKLEQAVIEIETEKATVDVPSDVVGLVQSILVSLGDVIQPGQAILTVGEGAEPAAESTSPEPEAAREAPSPAQAEGSTQLMIYALALSRRASIPLEKITCAWFDETGDYFEFSPAQSTSALLLAEQVA